MNTKSKTIVLCLSLAAFAGACKFLVQQIVDYSETWKSGLPKSRGSLASGLQSGEWVYFYESGKPRAKGGYQHDRQFGPWVFYYETGAVERSGAYDDKGLRTGEWTEQYADQTPHSRGRLVADFEDGPWQFFAVNGALERSGQYDAGKLSGPWSFFYAGGKPRARGMYLRGDRIGGWQMWDEAGQERTQDFGGKPGAQIVRETWANGKPKREGVLVNGAPVGRWTTYHDNGQLRFCCTLNGAAASGVFEARDAGGNVTAQGVLDKSAFGAGCVAVVAGQTRDIAAGPFAAAGEAAPWGEAAAFAALAPEAAVGVMVAEASGAVAPAAIVAVPVATTTPTPEATALVKKLDEEPTRAAAPAQPDLSVKQRQEMQSYVDTYAEGQKPGSVNLLEKYRGGSSSANAPKPQGTGELKDWYGKELPFQAMKGVDGKDVDLKQYRGKKKVMIVVLRGFLGEVCCYCVAQTKALSQSRERLMALGVEVLVIYPGARENEQSFEQAYKATFNEGAPPYRVFYDPNLELVTQLGIEGDLASPSTILLDKDGKIQFFYKGEHRADRPAAKKLIQFIEEMK